MSETPVVLIVDDEEEIRENLSDFVEYQGFSVLQAGDGAQALEILETREPDLIISDLMMPAIGGIQLLQELAARKIDIPVVIMTAFGTMEYAIEAMKNGAADFLAKPIDLTYMLKVMNKVLANSAMQQKIREQQIQLEDDLRHAAVIQRCLLPDPIENPYLSMHYRYEPLIAIGGDYMTVQQYSPQEVTVALYDVCGHGVSAALTASLINNQLQQRLAERRPPSNIINLLNRFIATNIDETSMFVTMAIVSIDLEEGRLIAANAGHPDLLVWRRQTNELESIASHMPPVGMIPRILGKINESALDIASGDRLILYTDGFLESRNPEGKMLGREGLQSMILKCCQYAPMEFLHSMYDDLAAYRAGMQDDDLTLMIIDIK